MVVPVRDCNPFAEGSAGVGGGADGATALEIVLALGLEMGKQEGFEFFPGGDGRAAISSNHPTGRYKPGSSVTTRESPGA